MNNETPEVNPRKSKCWTCKFGMCVGESELERVYHANMRGIGGPSPMGETDIFDDMSQATNPKTI